MTSLGDVYVDVHADTKGLRGEIKRATKEFDGAGLTSGKQFSAGFERGSVQGYGNPRRGGFFRSIARGSAFLGREMLSLSKDIFKAFKFSFDLAQSLGEGVFKSLAQGVGGAGAAFGKFITTLLASGPALAAVGAALLVLIPVVVLLTTLVINLVAALGAMALTLGGALLSAIIPIVGALAPLAVGFGVFLVAMKTLDDQTKQTLKNSIKPLTDQFRTLGKLAVAPVVAGLKKQIPELSNALKSAGLEKLFSAAGEALSGFLGQVTAGANSPVFKKFVTAVTDFIPVFSKLSGSILLNLGGAFAGIFRGATESATTFFGWLDKITGKFSAFVNSEAGQAKLKTFFTDLGTSAKAVGGLIKAVAVAIGGVFKAGGNKAGAGLFDSLTAKVKEFTEYIKNNPESVKKFFDDAKKVAENFGSAVLKISDVIGKLNNSASLALLNKALSEVEKTAKLVLDTLELIKTIKDALTPGGGPKVDPKKNFDPKKLNLTPSQQRATAGKETVKAKDVPLDVKGALNKQTISLFADAKPFKAGVSEAVKGANAQKPTPKLNADGKPFAAQLTSSVTKANAANPTPKLGLNPTAANTIANTFVKTTNDKKPTPKLGLDTKSADASIKKLDQVKLKEKSLSIKAILSGLSAKVKAALGLYTGGRIPQGYASGGVVPGHASGRGDNMLGLSSGGNPLRVRSGEWIINEKDSKRNNQLLSAINSGFNAQSAMSSMGSSVSNITNGGDFVYAPVFKGPTTGAERLREMEWTARFATPTSSLVGATGRAI